MARIVHIALKVDDLERATEFYEDVFGIYQLKTGYARGHTSRHMTEGSILP
jgi:lactoylglutathione lyase